MNWFKSIGTTVYVYVALIFTALVGYAKIQTKRLKTAKRELIEEKRTRELLIKKINLVAEIDETKAEKEQDAKNKHLKQIKDLGDLTNEINDISSDDLITELSGMLNYNKIRKDRDTAKISD